MLFIISVNFMYTKTIWGGFYMFSSTDVSECAICLRKQIETTKVDLFYINLHKQYTVK